MTNDNMDLAVGGVKYDKDKPRLDLVPPEVVIALGTVLTYGAAKYADNNWRKNNGMRWGRVYAAMQRHLLAWQKGEDVDPESGLPHLHHALANLAFLIAFANEGIGEDDRWPSPPATLIDGGAE